MKRFFVLEADTDMYNVFVREVTQTFELDEVRYSHKPGAAIVAIGTPGRALNEELTPLLITRGRPCEHLSVQNSEDQYGELCGKKCEPGSYLCAEHQEGQ